MQSFYACSAFYLFGVRLMQVRFQSCNDEAKREIVIAAFKMMVQIVFAVFRLRSSFSLDCKTNDVLIILQ